MDYIIPRFLSAVLAGVILSQTGSLIQMSSRNVLASPSTLGFDGLSILWILIFHSIMLFFGYEQPVLILFLTGIPLTVLIGWVYSKFIDTQKSIERLILIGLTFNLLVGAIFSFWQFLFLAFNLPFPVELWFGHFRFANLQTLGILALVECGIVVGWLFFRREFLLFTLGKNISRNLNLNQKSLFLFLFIAVSVGTFTVISLFGAFSFLALIFPYIARKFWFKRFDLAGELFLGALVNGLGFMLIDCLSYFFPIYGAEVPVGLIATGVGAVCLILLLWKSNGNLETVAKR